MKNDIHIFMFIDALGWEIIRNRDFLHDLLPHRYRVRMQFGYSSTAIPTILTGQPPTVHKHLSFYYYAPSKSPFRMFQLSLLKYLPAGIVDRWRVRHMLSKFVARVNGFTGYFEMYAMPFTRLKYFDYIEKQDIFAPGGLSPVPNIADRLLQRGIPHHISNWRLTESANVSALLRDIDRGDIEFAFLYTAAMDGLLHFDTKDGEKVQPKLDWYAGRIRRIVDLARKRYRNVTMHVMSDHGMTTKTGVADVRRVVEEEGFRFGTDYAAVYDSTMARFWFFSDTARDGLIRKLETVAHAHILSDEEKERYSIDFTDDMYGETYLLMDPGWQIEPCDMGKRALPGMHGFAPEHEDSYAAFLSSEPAVVAPEWVGDYHTLMVRKMDGAVSGG